MIPSNLHVPQISATHLTEQSWLLRREAKAKQCSLNKIYVSGIMLGYFHMTHTAWVLSEPQQKLFLSIYKIWVHCGKNIVLGHLLKGVIWHKCQT